LFGGVCAVVVEGGLKGVLVSRWQGFVVIIILDLLESDSKGIRVLGTYNIRLQKSGTIR